MAQVLRQSVGLAVFCLVAFASLSYKYGNNLTPFFCSVNSINMKSKILVSALVLASLLSACSKSSNSSPGSLYLIVNNGSHFTGQPYVNAVTGGNNVSVQTFSTNQSIDTIQVTSPSLTSGVTPGSYTIAVSSYRTSGGSAVPPVYTGNVNTTVSSGQTNYVNVVPQ